LIFAGFTRLPKLHTNDFRNDGKIENGHQYYHERQQHDKNEFEKQVPMFLALTLKTGEKTVESIAKQITRCNQSNVEGDISRYFLALLLFQCRQGGRFRIAF
jgi:hypothetical protein